MAVWWTSAMDEFIRAITKFIIVFSIVLAFLVLLLASLLIWLAIK